MEDTHQRAHGARRDRALPGRGDRSGKQRGRGLEPDRDRRRHHRRAGSAAADANHGHSPRCGARRNQRRDGGVRAVRSRCAVPFGGLGAGGRRSGGALCARPSLSRPDRGPRRRLRRVPLGLRALALRHRDRAGRDRRGAHPGAARRRPRGGGAVSLQRAGRGQHRRLGPDAARLRPRPPARLGPRDPLGDQDGLTVPARGGSARGGQRALRDGLRGGQGLGGRRERDAHA